MKYSVYIRTLILCSSFVIVIELFLYTLRSYGVGIHPVVTGRARKVFGKLRYFMDEGKFESEELVQQRLLAVFRSGVIRPMTSLPAHEQLYFQHKNIPRALTLSKFQENMYLLGNVTELLSKHNISYVLGQGTLLGSYFFHSMIPWDDDLDLFVDILDVNKLRSLFRKPSFSNTFGISSFHDWGDTYNKNTLQEDIPLNNTHSCGSKDKGKHKCYQMVKVYFHSSPKAGKTRWRYPFVDIFFTNLKNGRVENHENHKHVKNISVSVDDFYPLVLRPFHSLWLPAPHNTRAFLLVDYKQFICKQGRWNHQFERLNKKTSKSPCQNLTSRYPYVRRRPVIDDVTGNRVRAKVYEDLMLKGQVLHTALVPQSYVSEDLLQLDK